MKKRVKLLPIPTASNQTLLNNLVESNFKLEFCNVILKAYGKETNLRFVFNAGYDKIEEISSDIKFNFAISEVQIAKSTKTTVTDNFIKNEYTHSFTKEDTEFEYFNAYLQVFKFDGFYYPVFLKSFSKHSICENIKFEINHVINKDSPFSKLYEVADVNADNYIYINKEKMEYFPDSINHNQSHLESHHFENFYERNTFIEYYQKMNYTLSYSSTFESFSEIED